MIKAQLLEYLNSLDNGVTITDIIKGCDTFSEFSTQKLSALLKQLVDSGEVIKVVDKKKSYFFAAANASAENDNLT